MARQPGVLAGSYVVTEVFGQLSSEVTASWEVGEGEAFAAGDELGLLAGPLKQILGGERICLNFISHLSGIATHVAEWVRVADGRCEVWDTRKTLPAYRQIQKAAVRAGGGVNHRMSLSEAAMLKDNHLVGLDIAAGVAALREQWPDKTVEVEADTVEQAKQAVAAGVDVLMLDNFEPGSLAAAVVELGSYATTEDLPLPKLEASGGITLETLDAYASTGVDFVSSSSLTSGVSPIDIGLDMS